jgi:site-specific DNA-methyltransferase (adenine-specific)
MANIGGGLYFACVLAAQRVGVTHVFHFSRMTPKGNRAEWFALDILSHANNNGHGMNEKRYQLFNEDCRQGIKNISDRSIDFIVTDPPYFIDGMDDGWNDKNLLSKASKSGVVGGLPVGMKFDRTQGERLQKFLEPLCKEFMRIL